MKRKCLHVKTFTLIHTLHSILEGVNEPGVDGVKDQLTPNIDTFNSRSSQQTTQDACPINQASHETRVIGHKKVPVRCTKQRAASAQTGSINKSAAAKFNIFILFTCGRCGIISSDRSAPRIQFPLGKQFLEFPAMHFFNVYVCIKYAGTFGEFSVLGC